MFRLFGNARGRTADVERTHRELRAGLADRLGGDDADRFADLDKLAAGEVASVAAAANSAARFARQSRTDLDLPDPSFLDRVRQIFGALFVLADENVDGEHIVDIFLRHSADDADALRHEDVAAFHARRAGDADELLAVLLGDDEVLRSVDETAREISRVGSL